MNKSIVTKLLKIIIVLLSFWFIGEKFWQHQYWIKKNIINDLLIITILICGVLYGSSQFLYANAGEKLDVILQRMFLFATQPSCYNLSIAHLWHDEAATTSTAVTLQWDTIPDAVNAIDVQYAPVNSASI